VGTVLVLSFSGKVSCVEEAPAESGGRLEPGTDLTGD
jgi:hypothetical protein